MNKKFATPKNIPTFVNILNKMENHISISTDHLKHLLPNFEQRVKEIETLISDLLAEKDAINAILSLYKREGIIIPNAYVEKHERIVADNDYDKNSSYFERLKFFLRRENGPLSTAEITDLIIERQPELDRTKTLKMISSILGTKSEQGKEIEKVKNKGKDKTYRYALKN